MTRSWWSKLLLLVFFTGLSCVYVYPTIANLDLATTKFPFKQKINLGLDLQGGLYMVLGADFNKVFKEVVTRDSASLQDRAKEKGIAAVVFDRGGHLYHGNVKALADSAREKGLKF